ncbi:hypothetical protein M758_9G176400 [Ceratodon purpureus]|nr:hypothetical protein M758_9G176400 [Ceratodon purpureus]
MIFVSTFLFLAWSFGRQHLFTASNPADRGKTSDGYCDAYKYKDNRAHSQLTKKSGTDRFERDHGDSGDRQIGAPTEKTQDSSAHPRASNIQRNKESEQGDARLKGVLHGGHHP